MRNRARSTPPPTIATVRHGPRREARVPIATRATAASDRVTVRLVRPTASLRVARTGATPASVRTSRAAGRNARGTREPTPGTSLARIAVTTRARTGDTSRDTSRDTNHRAVSRARRGPIVVATTGQKAGRADATIDPRRAMRVQALTVARFATGTAMLIAAMTAVAHRATRHHATPIVRATVSDVMATRWACEVVADARFPSLATTRAEAATAARAAMLRHTPCIHLIAADSRPIATIARPGRHAIRATCARPGMHAIPGPDAKPATPGRLGTTAIPERDSTTATPARVSMIATPGRASTPATLGRDSTTETPDRDATRTTHRRAPPDRAPGPMRARPSHRRDPQPAARPTVVMARRPPRIPKARCACPSASASSAWPRGVRPTNGSRPVGCVSTASWSTSSARG